MSLKEATWEHHKRAEEQPFVGMMFGGKLHPKSYAIFLYNQIQQYDVLEDTASKNDVLTGLEDINRYPGLVKDFQELWGEYGGEAEIPPTLETTNEFTKYILEIDKDPSSESRQKRLMAHIYTRHMGDLMGGQMLAKKVPGSSAMYEFADPEKLKGAIRAKLDDSMADEVRVAYKFATSTFKEMLPYANVKEE
jgi:heme oxygenase|tara:strand:+ start:1017 stop:1595 length:579 start_codon:yes stop_codon:yes gene_type:complete